MSASSQDPFISVVTPSFNQGPFIAETIESVADQGYPRHEHIIVDAKSTDDTVEVLRGYGQLPTMTWTSEPDRGQTHAINKGFARATGDIVAYLNSDDRYCPGTFAYVAEYFATNPDCMWLCGNVLFSNADGHVFTRKRPMFSRFTLVFGSSSVYQPGVFLRKEVLTEFGPLREDFHTVMDLEWFCRIATRYSPHLVNRDLAIFRWHPQSKSSSGTGTKHYLRYLQERVEVGCTHYPKLCGVLKSYPEASLWALAQLARGDKASRRAKLALLGRASMST